jgi:Membrane bound O-acyl transferase family
MWVLAGSLFAGCKWLVYREAVGRGVHATPGRRAAFLFGWPGMDAAAFLGSMRTGPIAFAEWLWAFGKFILGAGFFWCIARHADGDLATGWIGMVGLIFILHFGGFHLLALAWQSVGVPAWPIMKNPAASLSLGEFWSRRWNVAFNDIAEQHVFRPLVRRIGPRWAGMAAFLFSGLLHDVVISIPARAGFGFPTLYFAIQGAGVWIERSAWGKRVGLRRGWRGWLFTMFVTAAPAFWLFHPPFVRHIILPMMTATHAR